MSSSVERLRLSTFGTALRAAAVAVTLVAMAAQAGPVLANVAQSVGIAAAPPSPQQPEAVCTCYCWCVADPTQGSCNGGGYCCIGSQANWLEPRGCYCGPCLFIFGVQFTPTACVAPDRVLLDLHLELLRAKSVHG